MAKSIMLKIIIINKVGGRLQLFCLWWQSQILKRRIFSYAFLKLTSKCAAMWDSQNGFAEKCAVA